MKGTMPPKINPDYCYYPLKLVKSPIHGWGVVAEKNIPKNQYVIEYTGQIINRKQHKLIANRKHVYTYTLDKYWSLDGFVGGSGAERINHSFDSNLYAYIIGSKTRSTRTTTKNWSTPGFKIATSGSNHADRGDFSTPSTSYSPSQALIIRYLWMPGSVRSGLSGSRYKYP